MSPKENVTRQTETMRNGVDPITKISENNLRDVGLERSDWFKFWRSQSEGSQNECSVNATFNSQSGYVSTRQNSDKVRKGNLSQMTEQKWSVKGLREQDIKTSPVKMKILGHFSRTDMWPLTSNLSIELAKSQDCNEKTQERE